MCKHSWQVGLLALAAAAGCGSKDDPLSYLDNHAVGTYIGGGSMALGISGSCSYAGTAGVFIDDAGQPSTTSEPGPRFVAGPGTITKDCGGQKSTVTARVPTSVTISGPATIQVGAKDESKNMYKGAFVADGKELGGEGSLDWQLGPDCAGVAEFAGVSGSQDTGGPSRARSLLSSGKAGTCTLRLTVTTANNTLYPSFKGTTLEATKKVTFK